MTPTEIFAVIKDKKPKRMKISKQSIIIEFHDLSTLYIELGCEYDDHKLRVDAYSPRDENDDWIE